MPDWTLDIDWPVLADVGIALLIALVAVVLVVAVISLIVRLVARRWAGVYATFGPSRRRFRVLLLIIAVWIALVIALPGDYWLDVYTRIFVIVTIAAGAWFISAVVRLFFDRILLRYDATGVTGPDNRVARRMQTQITILRRVAAALIVILAVAAILLTFPGAQAAGASLLASAGLVSVVAGLAAQSSLANLFAGMQLAFSDALRIDDVVIADGEYGRVEEITLTYVVVNTWDLRRLVLPSTYFTTTPFQNWTRESSELLGTVYLDVDWTVSPAAVREELERILAETDMWDGRASGVVVTDATGGFVQIRALVSASSAPVLWDLRCLVREKLVQWVHDQQPEILPRSRVTSRNQSIERAESRRALVDGVEHADEDDAASALAAGDGIGTADS
ncbi:MAG: mechanosensitive ion channel family protein [Microcella pacifica]|jgi:small-conductance mechanosensitive channel|uniref:mechanosensitive ion channel family protein n=1 Tax=Microcella pacifica TaxID=2591847 RepID=UPI0033149291